MTDVSDAGGRSGGVTASSAAETGWPGWYRPLIVAGLVGGLLASAAAFMTSKAEAPLIETAVTYLVLPLAIVGAIAAGRHGRGRYLVLAALLLDIEALLLALRAPVGLAYAVLFPLVGIVLVIPVVRGRLLSAAFLLTGGASVAAVAISLGVGPVSKLPELSSVGVAVAGTAVMIGFTLTHLGLFSDRRTRAIEAAEAELATRRAAEAELDRTTLLLRAILHASPVPTQAVGPDGSVILWNPASERVFGWTREELIGKPVPAAMIPEEQRVEAADRMRRVIGGQVVNGERVRRLARDGREVWLDTYGAPLVDSTGAAIGAAALLVDVTEQVSLESRLRQAEKMEAIGQLSGGIAHDFNNMLTAIRGYAELVASGLDADQAELHADVEQIVASPDRAADLTRQLLAFARRTVLAPRIIDPADVVTAFVPMLQRLLGEQVRLIVDLDAAMRPVRVDPAQLEQVILNLAVNARDAMPQGGTLLIRCANVAAPRHGTEGLGGEGVLLEVSDSGVGMDSATQARIFEPFFTTKEPGRGTGLGLATVFGIVSMSGGTIDVDSVPGSGTTFRIVLPAVPGDATQVLTDAARGTVVPSGDETVLIVEDEPAVRAFARRCLTGLGYTVLEAVAADDALALVHGYGERIDLVLSDVMLPGRPGPVLVQAIEDVRPGVRSLLCSGFVPDGDMHAITDGRTVLPKPYSREDLAVAVRAALDSPA
jgi:PAS domain S-box-containing protein